MYRHNKHIVYGRDNEALLFMVHKVSGSQLSSVILCEEASTTHKYSQTIVVDG